MNSAGGSFGLSFGLAFGGAILLATLSIAFTNMADASTVLSPAQQQQVADALEDDAQVVSNTQLEEQLAGQPKDVKAEIIRINTDARHVALQVALLVPIIAGLIGLFNSFRMMRLPDPKPSSGVDGMALGPPRVQSTPRRSGADALCARATEQAASKPAAADTRELRSSDTPGASAMRRVREGGRIIGAERRLLERERALRALHDDSQVFGLGRDELWCSAVGRGRCLRGNSARASRIRAAD